MRTDERVIPHWDHFRKTESSPLADRPCSAGSALDAMVLALLTPNEHLVRVTAALCAHPLVLTNATDLWISAVESLQRQGLDVAILGVEPTTLAQSDIKTTPPARLTLLVEGGVAVILCTSATMSDIETRVSAAQQDHQVRAVLCAGVQAWIWHLTNEGTPKPVHGVRLVHEIAPPPRCSSVVPGNTADAARRRHDTHDN